MSDPDLVRADFDRIALLEEPRWNHNGHCHAFLLGNLPERCGEVLDIGSGTGVFARLLAPRARSEGFPNVEYRVADIRVMDLPRQGFDAVVSIAAFPLNVALNLLLTGRLRPAAERRAAWAAHAAHESCVSFREIRRTAAEALGGGKGRPRMRQHLFWRYSLVWRKPGNGGSTTGE